MVGREFEGDTPQKELLVLSLVKFENKMYNIITTIGNELEMMEVVRIGSKDSNTATDSSIQ